MRTERGFTLIELLIVLAILGILIGVVAMSVGGLTGTAKERAMRSEMEIVRTAIDTYNTQDVAVDGAATLAAQEDPSQISGNATTGPGKYLRRDTKYYYIWDEGGEDLQVCPDDTGTGCISYGQ